MIRCPFCGKELIAIPTNVENRYAGGCNNDKCAVIFRTKKLYNKLEAVMTIGDEVRRSETKEIIKKLNI